MILYIAGPMSGRPEFNYPAFLAAEHDLKSHGYDVLNPARVDEQYPKPCADWPEAPPHSLCPHCEVRDWQWYMRKTIPMVCEADGLALLVGWEQSTGARLEHSVASALGMRSLSVQTWLYARSSSDG